MINAASPKTKNHALRSGAANIMFFYYILIWEKGIMYLEKLKLWRTYLEIVFHFKE